MAVSNGVAMPGALVSPRLRPFVVAFLLLQECVQLSCCGSRLAFLPGFEGPLPFHLETGYVAVGESEEIQLFYYFAESERNSKEDALFLWLTGGPGCSALSGLIYEIGPLNFNIKAYDRSLPEFVLNPYSWTKASSIIFVDSPVGTGFSYAENPLAYETGDFRQVQHLHQFLRRWLISHPEFISNPVYIGGDSYSGLTLPILVQEIMDGNDEGKSPAINIQGYVLGNPLTDPAFDQNAPVLFAHGMGLISDELYESLKRTCKGHYQFSESSDADCMNDLMAFHQCTSGLQTAQILEPLCGYASMKPGEMFGDRRSLLENFFLVREPIDLDLGCRTYGYRLSYSWTNDDNVREALHIRKGSIGDWQRCNNELNYTNDISSTLQYHAKLSARGCRSLIYSGDHDMIVPFMGTQAWIRSLNYSIIDNWRSWMVRGQVAGYTRTYSNGMTFATVKGGGHTAPEYKPEECFAMFERWISREPL
ncbi:serine carboxypeptidase-like 2 isoform X1 [Eucalyptus grandis]|uniref:serine carboxypeptidase-like 2 isoform X1 n=1 Tax=Eucalyptus grandis TaxID=71139 RepID=UPI00192EC86A|nr:serine carboxypeptidase-like 2 isoform X1 [Eucalyptus grandis]